MDEEVCEKDRREISAFPLDDQRAREFCIARRADGRWEVEYSKGKHKRIYDSLIDATAGAMDMAAAGSGPYSIRIAR